MATLLQSSGNSVSISIPEGLNDYTAYDCSGLNEYYFDGLTDILSPATDILTLASIESDVAKISANRSRTISVSSSYDMQDIKPEAIRNGDCMWSAFGGISSSSAMAIHHHQHQHSNGSGGGVAANGGNSGNANNNNSDPSPASSYSESSAVPPAFVTGGAFVIKSETFTDDDDSDGDENVENCNNNKTTKATTSTAGATTATASIKIPKPKQSLLCHRMLTSNNTNNNSNSSSSNNNTNNRSNNSSFSNSYNKYQCTAEQFIPPGASLLRKSNNNNNNNTNNTVKQQQQRSTKVCCSNNVPEFRHNVDLSACFMGSNNIMLTNSADAKYIDELSRALQSPSKEHLVDYPFRLENDEPQISDVLDVISQDSATSGDMTTAAVTLYSSVSPPPSSSGISSSGFSSAASTSSSTSSSSSSSSSSLANGKGKRSNSNKSNNCESDSDEGECMLEDSSCGSPASLDDNNYMRHISDHSYTRNEMETNLETPSDSDEEIDVVSLNDKELPTNPSDRDRRALQTKVANKMFTIPPMGRIRFQLPYTPASSSPVKSEANSRYPSPSSTPHQSANRGGAIDMYDIWSLCSSSGKLNNNNNNNNNNNSSSSSNNNKSNSSGNFGASRPTTYSLLESKRRKRYLAADTLVFSGKDNKCSSVYGTSAAAKKSRGKKTSDACGAGAGGGGGGSGGGVIGSNIGTSLTSFAHLKPMGAMEVNSLLKRQCSLDEADTIEKRNLHNDMERQRRIGLKNLFETLKKQIPNIRDKERAPKVNILREAAKLCEQLSNEERVTSLKRQCLKAKLKQKQEKLARLRQSKNMAD